MKSAARVLGTVALAFAIGIAGGYTVTEVFDQSSDAVEVREVYKTWLDSLREQAFLLKTSTSLGSAFHIGDGWVLTAHHVIEGGGPYELVHFDGEWDETRTYAAYLKHADEDLDLAVLYLPEFLGKDGLTLGREEHLKKNGSVSILGCPSGSFPPSLSMGILRAEGYYNILVDAGVWYGKSGGACLDAESGYVIGLVIQIGFRSGQAWKWNWAPQTDLGVCIHVDRIREALDKWKVPYFSAQG